MDCYSLAAFIDDVQDRVNTAPQYHCPFSLLQWWMDTNLEWRVSNGNITRLLSQNTAVCLTSWLALGQEAKVENTVLSLPWLLHDSSGTPETRVRRALHYSYTGAKGVLCVRASVESVRYQWEHLQNVHSVNWLTRWATRDSCGNSEEVSDLLSRVVWRYKWRSISTITAFRCVKAYNTGTQEHRSLFPLCSYSL